MGSNADPTAERKARFELDAIEADLEIGPGKSIAVDRAAYHRRSAKNEIDFIPSPSRLPSPTLRTAEKGT